MLSAHRTKQTLVQKTRYIYTGCPKKIIPFSKIISTAQNAFCCLVGAIFKILCPRERRVFQSKLGVSSSNQCNLHHSPHTGHLGKENKKGYNLFRTLCIEARSRNHCCRGKAISITYSECLSVALIIRHAKRMRRVMLSSVVCLGLSYFFHISWKARFSVKYLLNITCVFSLSIQIWFKNFIILIT
jgi:hypothetical protein